MLWVDLNYLFWDFKMGRSLMIYGNNKIVSLWEGSCILSCVISCLFVDI